jgi:hypothetical protein
MDADEDKPTRVFRIGWWPGYPLGIIMLWMVWDVFRGLGELREHLPHVAGISGMALMALCILAVAHNPIARVGETELRVRDWLLRSRTVPIAEIRGMRWTYRYPVYNPMRAGPIGGWDHRAVLRLDLDAPSGEQRHFRITYAGRLVHATIADLADVVASRAGLLKTRKSDRDALVFREDQIDWIRSGGIHHAP